MGSKAKGLTTAERFHYMRKSRGWTQAQLATALGVKPAFISHVEKGIRLPSLEWLRDAADKLDWPREEFSPDLAPRPRPDKPES